VDWRAGVVYQIYPRSFMDSDGDGIGDLDGIVMRLDHLVDLGVSALWLSPIYPSPMADFGYDVSDYEGVDPVFGSLEAWDRLVHESHARGLRVLLDLVPCHSSIEHPWFREHPDWYIWGGDGEAPPNNWLSAFGGPAWSKDARTGHWYLHSFYPEQPDLDWHNPEVVLAFQRVLRFWVDRGADGFRLDAIDRLVKDRRLRDNPPATAPFGLPLNPEEARLEARYSRDQPEVVEALAALREAVGDALLVGEVYVPTARMAPYLSQLDRAFVFELLHAPWEEPALRGAIEAAAALRGRPGAGPAWVFSNHDFGRLSTRFGRDNERAAAVLLLTLPGTAFLYQGDEIGLANGPGAQPPHDRLGRDVCRHPMQWDASEHGGFTTGEPWLPVVDPAQRNVESQRDDPGSMMSLYKRLIELRRELDPSFRLVDLGTGVLAFERGSDLVALNLSPEPARLPRGEVLLESAAEAVSRGVLAPHCAAVVRPG
jgi:alpha-glucosidase